MKHPKVILLAGNKQVGKDTFYSILNNLRPQKFYPYSFADQLKHDLDTLSLKMFDKRAIDLVGKEKEIFRPILIAYGCAWRELDINHWVKVVDQKISWDMSMLDGVIEQGSLIPVIRDNRFVSETEYFIDKYGKENVLVVGITRENAPEPTDEEKRNYPDLVKYVNYWINWPTLLPNKKGELSSYVEGFLKSYNL